MDPLALLRKAGLEAEGPALPLHGGDISRVWRVGRFVVKTAQDPPPGLFRAEARKRPVSYTHLTLPTICSV